MFIQNLISLLVFSWISFMGLLSGCDKPLHHRNAVPGWIWTNNLHTFTFYRLQTCKYSTSNYKVVSFSTIQRVLKIYLVVVQLHFVLLLFPVLRSQYSQSVSQIRQTDLKTVTDGKLFRENVRKIPSVTGHYNYCFLV